MKHACSKLTAILAAVLLFLFLCPPALAENSHTQSEAVAWANARASEQWNVDYDGAYGVQCVDLIMYYYHYLVGYHVSGNGYDYQTNSLPSGWWRDNTASPGAVAVWGSNVGIAGSYGHVAIVTAVSGNNFYYVNTSGSGTRYCHSGGPLSVSNPSCYIHPDFKAETGTLDVNFLVNGQEIVDITGIGTFDVTCAGTTLTGQTDYCKSGLANGASYTISNITPAAGYNYTGLRSNSDALSGNIVAGAQRSVWLCFDSKTYTVSYDANGGTGAPASQTKTHGVALTLSSVKPTRDNYDFLGWSASATATTATYQPGGQYTANASKTLYAVWQMKTFTLTLNPNGGTVDPAAKSVHYQEAYGALPTPTRAGYNFVGWYTAADGGTLVTSATKLTVPANQTIFAHWSPLGELALPSAVSAIEAEAFLGDSRISHVVIPAGCESIGSKAFSNCENLISVRILGKDTLFESDTFAGSPNVVIYCYSGSRAQRLASADGLPYHLIGTVSDWVLIDKVPQGAEITDRKWTYTEREYAESASATNAGWTKYDTRRTGWTGWSAWQNTEIAKTDDNEVKTQRIITGYTMISYCVSGPNGRSYQPSPTYSVRLQHGPYQWTKAEFDAARVFAAGSYFDYADNVAGYVLDATGYCKWDGSDNGGYIPMFIQDTVYATQWSYRDAVYTYYYYRDVNGESATDPSGLENVSNIQEWVKYTF